SAGCSTTSNVTVPVRTLAAPTINLDFPVSCAGTANHGRVAQAEPGTYWQTVQWSIANGTITSHTYDNVDFTTDPSGQADTPNLPVTDNTGCTATASVVVPLRTVTPPAIHLTSAASCP